MRPGTLFPGMPMRTARPAHHRQAPPPGRLVPGTPMQSPKPARRVLPGTPMQRPRPAKRARKIRGLSLGDVQCCAAEALAASLRLAGGSVADEDVLALYWHTARSPDAGTTIEAAADHGLAGTRPLTCECVNGAYNISTFSTPLILGLDLPEGPHFVTDDGTAWWSWGQPCDPASFPHAVIEEAWEVRWAA